MSRIPFLLLASFTFWLAIEAAGYFGPPRVNNDAIIGIGLIAGWRYSWLLLNIFRAAFYQLVAFPKIRNKANQIPKSIWEPPCLHIIFPTYMEDPKVTQQVFLHMVREINTLSCPTYIYVASGGDEENKVILDFFQNYPFPKSCQLIFLKQEGKRHGMAFALRAARRRDPNIQGMVLLMDGDSIFGEGIFAKTLPLFHLDPKLGALTTNNIAVVRGPKWYRAWYTLRFALRSRYMASQALSNKVLTLTGRFSMFRGSAALTKDFIDRIESDSISTLAEGEIIFKTGDDKSTWFQLLKDGWNMTYVPDTSILCMENAGPKPITESHAKMRRWFGNMLRNNMRAIYLGPKKMGFFIWMAIVDQRISPWTSLLLPTAILVNIIAKEPLTIFYFTAWVIGSRSIYLASLSTEEHKLNAWDLPLLIYQQWVGSLIKISVLSNLKQQSWSTSRGGKQQQASIWSQIRVFLWLLLWVLFIAFWIM